MCVFSNFSFVYVSVMKFVVVCICEFLMCVYLYVCIVIFLK